MSAEDWKSVKISAEMYERCKQLGKSPNQCLEEYFNGLVEEVKQLEHEINEFKAKLGVGVENPAPAPPESPQIQPAQTSTPEQPAYPPCEHCGANDWQKEQPGHPAFEFALRCRRCKFVYNYKDGKLYSYLL